MGNKMKVNDNVKLVNPLLNPQSLTGKLKILEIENDKYRIGKSKISCSIWVTSDYLEKTK